MVKVVTLFLVAVLVLAMFGKLGWLGKLAPGITRKRVRSKPALCKKCGRYIIGSGPCDCQNDATKG
ncbi:hypothetical protein [Pseudorhodobacter sp.]|uniref:hypothetical protein n=1 Tax=Pseudorhodobacter sp. TaxID=1934400 RepID=UPI002647F39A|nr:hypothetical protein [Pseudorhodobacter sp.]MDN5787309.1 hypothetical protein [Pseudorhodobacter sp.]